MRLRFDLVTRRPRPVIAGIVAALLVGALVVAVTRDEGGKTQLRADERAAGLEDDAPPTTESVGETTSTSTATTVVDVAGPSTTLRARAPVTSPPTTAPVPRPGFGPNRIVYEAGGNVFSVDADGAGPVAFGTGSAPSWAPDRFSFVALSDYSAATMVVRDRFGGSRTLSATGHDTHPAWSPDGTRIAFSRYAPSDVGCCAIWVANQDGSDAHRVADSVCINGEPAWTPDSKRIVFWSSRNYCGQDPARPMGNYEIFIVDADGSNLQQLPTPANSGSPSISPDGKRIVFATDRDDHHDDRPGTWDIWTMNIDGSNQTRITTFAGNDTEPDWSPDGDRVVFHSDRDGGGLFTMRPDGSDVKKIVSGAAAKNPSW